MRELLIEKYISRSPIYTLKDGTNVYLNRSGREVYEKIFNPVCITSTMGLIYGQRIYIEAPVIGQMIFDDGHIYIFLGPDDDWVQIS